MQNKSIYDLELHEETEMHPDLTVMRVHGGWLYSYSNWVPSQDAWMIATTTFVPDDSPFIDGEECCPDEISSDSMNEEFNDLYDSLGSTGGKDEKKNPYNPTGAGGCGYPGCRLCYPDLTDAERELDCLPENVCC